MLGLWEGILRMIHSRLEGCLFGIPTLYQLVFCERLLSAGWGRRVLGLGLGGGDFPTSGRSNEETGQAVVYSLYPRYSVDLRRSVVPKH